MPMSKSIWTYSLEYGLIGSRSDYHDLTTVSTISWVNLASASSADRKILDDPRQWWLKVSCGKYPIVFRMACNYLPIPAASCECERASSGARRTITCDRNTFSSDTIETLQLEKNWLHRGIVESDLLSRTKRPTFLLLKHEGIISWHLLKLQAYIQSLPDVITL